MFSLNYVLLVLMPVKRPPLINGQIYHIVIRVIEGLRLFRDEKDLIRFIHNLSEFNDENPVPSNFRVYQHLGMVNLTRNVLVKRSEKKKRKRIIEILAFCLMPTHVHLLVRQLRKGGISKFMRKNGAGYGLYYNLKYERKGHVFAGRYKIVLIKNNEQLKTIFVYIHTNPVAIIFPGWKEKGIKNLKKAIKFLEEKYLWSSYPDYLGKKNFPSLTNREFLLKVMKGRKGCREFVNGWLKFKRELADLEKIAIE